MNVLSLFSGIGGLDLGLERAGMTVAGQVEIDPWCRRVLAKHWPEVPRHDDVRTAAAWWGGRRAPDLVCGGFPCQPASQAGPKLAQADPRWLWPALADIIRRLRPRYVLLENVPGLLGRGMGDVLGDLAASGYDAEWCCVSASDLGAPHLRERVWIVAYPMRPRLARIQSGSGRAETGGRRHAARPRTAPRRLWPAEPAVDRVAHGVPGRVDRLRGLGNAVVPQVAEHIGRMIMDAERAA